MKRWILTLGALLALGANAQTLTALKVEPAAAKVGEPVKITAVFDPSEMANCGLRVHFGDGTVEKHKISKSSDMPLVVTRSYAQAGQYKVEAEPTTAGTTLKCLGKRQSAMLTVAAAAPAAQPAVAPTAKPAAVKPVALCPEGWALSKPGQNAKTKAFSCNAKAGTKIPEPKLSCPGDLTYFENSKKGQLGCRV